MHPDSNEKTLKEEHARQTGEALDRDRTALAASVAAATVAIAAPATSAPASRVGTVSAPASAAPATASTSAKPPASPAPVPASFPSASAAASAQRPSSGAAAEPACEGKTIYVQIYGDKNRDAVRRQFREPWRALGASVPPIEDVLSTARSRGTRAPLAVEQTTVRYHDIGSLDCARRLATAAGATDWRVEPLSAALKPSRNVIEVWVAPTR